MVRICHRSGSESETIERSGEIGTMDNLETMRRERDSFGRNGFIGPITLFTRAQCQVVLRHFRHGDPPTPLKWGKGQAASDRLIFDFATRPALLARLRLLLGNDILLCRKFRAGPWFRVGLDRDRKHEPRIRASTDHKIARDRKNHSASHARKRCPARRGIHSHCARLRAHNYSFSRVRSARYERWGRGLFRWSPLARFVEHTCRRHAGRVAVSIRGSGHTRGDARF